MIGQKARRGNWRSNKKYPICVSHTSCRSKISLHVGWSPKWFCTRILWLLCTSLLLEVRTYIFDHKLNELPNWQWAWTCVQTQFNGCRRFMASSFVPLSWRTACGNLPKDEQAGQFAFDGPVVKDTTLDFPNARMSWASISQKAKRCKTALLCTPKSCVKCIKLSKHHTVIVVKPCGAMGPSWKRFWKTWKLENLFLFFQVWQRRRSTTDLWQPPSANSHRFKEHKMQHVQLAEEQHQSSWSRLPGLMFCSRYLVKKKLQLGGIESMLDVGGQPQGSSQRETMLFGFVFSLVTNSPRWIWSVFICLHGGIARSDLTGAWSEMESTPKETICAILPVQKCAGKHCLLQTIGC